MSGTGVDVVGGGGDAMEEDSVGGTARALDPACACRCRTVAVRCSGALECGGRAINGDGLPWQEDEDEL